MPKLSIQLHPSIRIDDKPHQFEKEYQEITIIDGLNEMLEDEPEIYDLVLKDGGPKPGILYMANKTELQSLGLLQQNLDEDVHIRIVPVLHGG